MNYRHIYHAGNFADLVKHVFLIALLNHFKKKEAPFCYLDTHAGLGLYNIESEEAKKKKEYETGVFKLLQFDAELPDEINQYLKIIHQLNKHADFQYYPGSPWIAKSILRDRDKMILCELHKEDVLTLKNNFKNVKNAAVHFQDAYLGMKAFLPPREKRGLVLIDPPFEALDEFQKIFHALSSAIKHWHSGCYMIWYPVKEKSKVEKFLADIISLEKPYTNYFFSISTESAKTALKECGICIINPPWLFDNLLKEIIFPFLKRVDIYSKRLEMRC